jgi:hypothetical protein
MTFNAYADCSPKDLTNPDYLKSIGKEGLIDHFKIPRDQDGVGWCGAYAPSDSLSFAVGEPISAIDISINQYANEGANSKTNSRVVGKRLEELRGIIPSAATDVARKNGYCPESVIPSNQTSSSNLGHSAILKLMSTFQQIHDDYNSKGRPTDYCVDCNENYAKIISPSLPGVTADMIQNVLNNNQSNSLESFRDLLNKLCEGRRIKVDPQVDIIYKNGLFNKKISNVLDEAIDNNSMPSVRINTSFFARSESLPGGHGDHEMMIVARRMGENGKCEYQVRNSWGRGCSYYQPVIAAKCEPEKGSFWMNQDQLQESVDDVLVIKNERMRAKAEPTKSDTKLSNNKNPNFPLDLDIDNIIETVTETASKITKSISEVVSSIWKSFSSAFKY